jgi:metal-responsive CopG/Arc/MetJ family transcriptional regulator
MRVVTVRMEEELICRLEELAELRGMKRSALIKEILREALDKRSSSQVREALLALCQGRRPCQEIDWTEIERELQQSEPCFPTVEEALAHSRKRSLTPK